MGGVRSTLPPFHAVGMAACPAIHEEPGRRTPNAGGHGFVGPPYQGASAPRDVHTLRTFTALRLSHVQAEFFHPPYARLKRRRRRATSQDPLSHA
ncbi:hypothetical protein D3C71_1972710 [compost metagenome]